jgi:hypothetical protein
MAELAKAWLSPSAVAWLKRAYISAKAIDLRKCLG